LVVTMFMSKSFGSSDILRLAEQQHPLDPFSSHSRDDTCIPYVLSCELYYALRDYLSIRQISCSGRDRTRRSVKC
jgi:hypothetical protein